MSNFAAQYDCSNLNKLTCEASKTKYYLSSLSTQTLLNPYPYLEAIAQRCSVKKVFLEISQIRLRPLFFNFI